MTEKSPHAILVIAREPAFHQNLHHILSDAADTAAAVEIISAYQPETGLNLVGRTVGPDSPFAVILVAIEAEAAQNNLEFVARLASIVDDVKTPIVLGFDAQASYPWDDILVRLDRLGNLFMLKDVTDGPVVRQLVQSLLSKRINKNQAAANKPEPDPMNSDNGNNFHAYVD